MQGSQPILEWILLIQFKYCFEINRLKVKYKTKKLSIFLSRKTFLGFLVSLQCESVVTLTWVYKECHAFPGGGGNIFDKMEVNSIPCSCHWKIATFSHTIKEKKAPPPPTPRRLLMWPTICSTPGRRAGGGHSWARYFIYAVMSSFALNSLFVRLLRWFTKVIACFLLGLYCSLPDYQMTYKMGRGEDTLKPWSDPGIMWTQFSVASYSIKWARWKI